MARFNTALTSASITCTATIGSPNAGSFTNLTGTAPYTVTVPNPQLHPGVNQVFYNATSGTVTLTTPSGNFNGTGGNGTANTGSGGGGGRGDGAFSGGNGGSGVVIVRVG